MSPNPEAIAPEGTLDKRIIEIWRAQAVLWNWLSGRLEEVKETKGTSPELMAFVLSGNCLRPVVMMGPKDLLCVLGGKGLQQLYFAECVKERKRVAMDIKWAGSSERVPVSEQNSIDYLYADTYDQGEEIYLPGVRLKDGSATRNGVVLLPGIKVVSMWGEIIFTGEGINFGDPRLDESAAKKQLFELVGGMPLCFLEALKRAAGERQVV